MEDGIKVRIRCSEHPGCKYDGKEGEICMIWETCVALKMEGFTALQFFKPEDLEPINDETPELR